VGVGGVVRLGIASALAPVGSFLILAGAGAGSTGYLDAGAACLVVALVVAAAPTVSADDVVVAGALVVRASKRPRWGSYGVCRLVVRLEPGVRTPKIRVRGWHTPVEKWPVADARLPVEVPMTAPWRLRVAWRDATALDVAPNYHLPGQRTWRQFVGEVRPGRRRLTINWAWRSPGIDVVLEDRRAWLTQTMLTWQRRYCARAVADLLKAPEMLAMTALTGATAPQLAELVGRRQRRIFERTASARSEAIRRTVPAIIAMLVVIWLVVPRLLGLLGSLLSILFGPDGGLGRAARWEWAPAVRASGLGTWGIAIVFGCLTVLAVALVGRGVRMLIDAENATATLRREIRHELRVWLRITCQRLVNRPEAAMLQVRTAPGLGGLTPTQLVPRREVARIRGLALDLGSGAIAISGARGVGKSTVIATLAGDDTADDPDMLRLSVSAPVQYDAREFLLHLYARLCKTVLRHTGYRWHGSPLVRFASRSRTVIAVLVAVVGGVAFLTPFVPAGRRLAGDYLPAADVPITAFLATAALWVMARWLRPPGYADHALAAEAARRLGQTRFLQTLTAEHHGTVGRGGVEIGRSRSRALAEQPLSLPDVVDSYREFATAVAAWWRAHRSGHGTLLIGIDEVDRITDPALAERFLNEIKAVFGVPHCVYLVSISDEALVTFERRVARARTVFDSAFDQHVRLEPLSLIESVELLRLRLPGVPDRFLALCHCLSGGMPRDVLRVARTMFDLHRETAAAKSLPTVAQDLVAAEIRAIKRGFQIGTDRWLTGPNSRIPILLSDADWPGRTGPEIGRRATADLDVGHDGVGSAPDLAAALIFYGTVLEFFTERSSVVDAWVADTLSGAKPAGEQPEMDGIADAMARLHRTLAVDAGLAIGQLAEFRAACGFRPLNADSPAAPGTAPEDLTTRN
jgi:hypothetical protein